MNACLSPPIVVPVGGKLESGTYRVVWTGVLTAFDSNVRGFGPELPLEQRVSAPITIQVP